ncbi:MAG: hypothetical protein JXA52_00890 [Planctomycetes bacterium]|nr:hypothetical protein [Planctomycetota bacterium]
MSKLPRFLSSFTIIISLSFSLFAAATGTEPEAIAPSMEIEDPEINEYLFGSGMELPVKERDKVFLATANRANFTTFLGVEEVELDGESLAFTVTGEEAILGWGNYKGEQVIAEIANTWQEYFAVKLQLSQSSDKSEWRLRYWSDGQPQSRTGRTVLEGQGEQELAFEPLQTSGPNPDGLELRIRAEAGTRIKLKSVKLVQPIYEGYCRGDFTLPEGGVWRAIANATITNYAHLAGNDEVISRLYINGEEITETGMLSLDHTIPVDIAKYLKPGKNVAGFYGRRIGKNPPLYFQAKIVMVSGAVIETATAEGWRFSPDYQEGWNQAEFDSSAWLQVKAEDYGEDEAEVVSGVMELYYRERKGSAPKIDLRGPARQLGIPEYGGVLVMKNPSRPDLFYRSSEDAIVEVYTPIGFKDKSPQLTAYFSKADLDGDSQEVSQKTISDFKEINNSLVYTLNLGKQPFGVYALALKLTGSDGKVIAERSREPLVILRRLELKKIAGTDYKEGLELELEDTIDFTNPEDPHPWRESRMPASLTGMVAPRVEAPTITQNGEMRYREVTDPRRGSGFSYRIEFKHPGSFYLMELEYPDDAQRITVVSITSKREKIWTNSQTGAGIETGGKLYLTNKMQKLNWIHVADEGPHTVDVLNAINNQNGAAKLLRIYRVKGDLPSVESGNNRNYGIHSERCFYTSGIGRSFGSRYLKNAEGWEDTWLVEPETEPLMKVQLRDLVWLLETGERYVQYLKFSGQNTHVMGCYQYNEGDTPFVPVPLIETSRIRHCMRTMMANLFEINNIDFYAGVGFSQSGRVRGYANNAEVAKGADTPWLVNGKGEQRYGFARVSEVQNFMHPAVQGKFFDLLESLSRAYAHLPRYRGVHHLSGPDSTASYWLPGYGLGSNYDNPLEASFDDHAMERFAKETGNDLGIAETDPSRFAKRFDAIKADEELRRNFLDWRAGAYTAFCAEAVQRLKNFREDLELVNTLVEGDKKFCRYLANSEDSFQDIMKDFGIDLEGLGALENYCNTRWTISWQDIHGDFPSQDSYCWLARTDPGIVSAFAKSRQRGVLVRTSWDENMLLSGGYMLKSEGAQDRHLLVESDWIMNCSKTRTLPQPSGYHAREAFIQAIITADPGLVLGGWTDLHINVGHEQELRSIMQTFTHLPKADFEVVMNTGLTTNLAIRKYSSGNESWIYVANPGYWHIAGSVVIEAKGRVYEIPSGRETGTNRDDGMIHVPVKLNPYGLAVFRVNSKDLKILEFHTQPISGPELSFLSNIIERADKLLADPQIKLSISEQEQDYLHQTIAASRHELAQGLYAKVWNRVTNYQFYHPWWEFLEKAAQYQAFLPESLAKIDPNPDPEALPTMLTKRATGEITIDGRLDEAAWEAIPFTTGFWKVKEKQKSILETGVKALYDDKNLYVAFACADREPDKLKASAEMENEIYGSRDDVLAMMIHPDAEVDLYYQLAFNTKGVHFDQKVENGGRDYDFKPPWQTVIWKGQGYWTAEVLIPLGDLEQTRQRERWLINFYRKYRNDLVAPSCWSYQGYIDWHTQKRLGRLRFE